MIIHPPEYTTSLGWDTKRAIFLAGPIQGVASWQSRASDLLHVAKPHVIIASPRRGAFKPDQFEEQVHWETYWLKRAANCGRIMFYLAAEDVHDCTRAYAQTTRFELGEWLAKASEHVVIGAEPGFTGLKYIETRLKNEYGNQVHQGLEATCQAVLDQI